MFITPIVKFSPLKGSPDGRRKYSVTDGLTTTDICNRKYLIENMFTGRKWHGYHGFWSRKIKLPYYPPKWAWSWD